MQQYNDICVTDLMVYFLTVSLFNQWLSVCYLLAVSPTVFCSFFPSVAPNRVHTLFKNHNAMQRNRAIDAQRHLIRETSASLYCVRQYKMRKAEVGLITVSQTNIAYSLKLVIFLLFD